MNWVRDWRLRKARRKLVVLGVMSGSTAPEYRHDRRKFAHGNILFPWTFVPHDLSGADSAIAEAAKADYVVILLHRPSKFRDLADRSEQYQFDAFLDRVKASTDVSGSELRALCLGEMLEARYAWARERVELRLPGKMMTEAEFDQLVFDLGLPRILDTKPNRFRSAKFGTFRRQLCALKAWMFQLLL